MARQKINPTKVIQQSIEIGLGAALLTGLLARFVFEFSQPTTFQTAAVTGGVLALFWLARPLIGWLFGLDHPPGVPRWWARRNTGILISVAWGAVAYAIAYYQWQWTPQGSLEIALYNALGLFAIWLMKPFTIWLTDLLTDGIRTLFRLRAPRIPLLEWNRSTTTTRDSNSMDDAEELLTLTPREFEELCAAIGKGWGYDARAVGESGDGGIDVQMWKNGEFVVAQCKRYVGTVPIGNVRDFYGAMLHVGAKRGYFFTTARFSDGAYKFVEGKSIELVDGVAVAQAVRKHRVRL